MAVDTPRVQWTIAKWTVGVTLLIGGLSYILGGKTFAYGLVFGVVVSIVNYRVVGIIIDIAFRATSPDLAKVLSFAGYHVRFWILVVILYLVIPRSPFYFSVGTFVGLLIPKMIMGVVVVMDTRDKRWDPKTPAAAPPPRISEGAVNKPKEEQEGLRFPGLDYDDRFKDTDDRFKDTNNWF